MEYKPLYTHSTQQNYIISNSISNFKDLKNRTNSYKDSSNKENSFLAGKMRIIKLDNYITQNQIKSQIYSSNKNKNTTKYLVNQSNKINSNNYCHKNNNFSYDIKSYNFKPNNIINNKTDLNNRRKINKNKSPDFLNKNIRKEFDLEINSDYFSKKRNYHSNSNKNIKKTLNFNLDFVEDIGNISYRPKNINNLEIKKSNINSPKCFNKYKI